MAAANVDHNLSKGDVLLEGDFEVFPNEKTKYKVELTRSGITYYPINGSKTGKFTKYLHFGDIIGCRCRKSLEPKHSKTAYITVFVYPLRKKLFSGKWTRHQDHVTFAMNSGATFDKNRKVIEKWRRVILNLARNLTLKKEDVERCGVPPKMKMMALVNPHSGPGKAMQIYHRHVAPMFDEADVHVKVIETEYAGHASELMAKINRHDYHGVVIVSGDGLIYEVINGLMSRPDWQDAIKLPVGCLPGGSGNALCSAINYAAGEPYQEGIALHSTFVLVKHRVVAMDLVLVEQPQLRTFSFLSITYGLLADIDYESEKYRAIGEARFTLQAIKRILALRRYKVKLSFLPVMDYIPKSSDTPVHEMDFPRPVRRVSLHSMDDQAELSGSSDEMVDRLRSKSVPSKLFLGETIPSPMDDQDFSEFRLTDCRESSISVSSDIRECDADNQIVSQSPDEADGDGKTPQFGLYNEDAPTSTGQPSPAKSPSEYNSVNNFEEVYRLSKRRGEAVPSSLLPPLDAPVPGDWVTMEEEFVSVMAVYQTHLNSTFICAPHAHFSDGIINLMLVRASVTKQQLFSMMTSAETGSQFDNPIEPVENIKVLAFRLEPVGDTAGILMVDGEKVDSQLIQAQVLPGLANIMAIR